MVNEAYAIDEKNRNTLWQDIIQKEMETVKIALQIISEGKKPPHGFQYVDCHKVFDIETVDFRRKACLVAQGHMTHTPDTITYSSLVTRETVCIAITMVVLYDLEFKAVDVLNNYVMAPN